MYLTQNLSIDEEDARFVELSDCGHMFEVESLDQWMDMAEAKEDGKGVDIQLKQCPKCKTPIRTSLRYGNIVKTILADFEKVKKKSYLSEEVKKDKVDKVLNKLHVISGNFSKQVESTRRFLTHPNLTAEQLNMVENQVNFLKLLNEILMKIQQELDDQTHRYPEKQIEMTLVSMELKDQVKTEVDMVMKKRARLSEQQLEEINSELMRFLLVVSLRIVETLIEVQGTILSVTDSVKMQFVKDILESESVIGK